MEDIDYTRHYKNWHSDSNAHVENMLSFYKKRVLHHFPKNKNSEILDIGCGMGFLLLALKDSRYNNIQGIDIDEGQVNSCNKKGLNVQLVKDSIEFLKNNSKKYDVITAFDVLEHIPPKEQLVFISAIKNALNEGGSFICSVPNASSLLGSRNRYIDYTHYVAFTEISLDFVLFNGGFRMIQISPMDFIYFSLNPLKLLHWLVFKLFRAIRRLSYIAELGFRQGLSVPLSFNLIGKAVK